MDIFICLPYRYRAISEDAFSIFVYAGSKPPHSDGDTVKVTYDGQGKPIKFELIEEEQ